MPRSLQPADARPVRSKKARADYALAHPWCLCCGVPAYQSPWPGIECHHLIRPGRSDEPCNLMLLCAQCHALGHGARIRLEDGTLWPWLTFPLQLSLKRLRDPLEWRPARLEALWARHLPDVEALPSVFVESYEGWRPDDPTYEAVRALVAQGVCP